MDATLLTDKKIDLYALRGNYGLGKQKRWLKAVEQGRLRHLHSQIKRGDAGPLAQAALNKHNTNKNKHPLLIELEL